MTTTLTPTSTASTGEDQRQALAARVRDPLWLLARQWQTGGFIANDGGTPVHVTVTHASTPILIAGGTCQTPLEPLIEAEPQPPIENVDTATLVRYAVEMLRRLTEAGVPAASLAALRNAWTTSYPLTTADPNSPRAAAAACLPNPVSIFHLLYPALSADGTGTFPAALDTTSAGAAGATAQTGVRAWYAWLAPQVARPGTAPAGRVDPAQWNPQRLEYAFSATSGTPRGSLTLNAPAYDGTGFDWYSFDAQTSPTAGPTASSTTIEVHPTPVTYPGMPRPRFWEFEDGDINLDALRDSSDPAHALLATFAHTYANDWFLFPLPDIGPGVAVISNLTVRDTFGAVIGIQAVADLDSPGGPWRLWELESAAPAARGARILLPPTPLMVEGPLIEEVLVARDEMANLAWMIELTTRDTDGNTVDRYRRWLALRAPDDPSYRPAERAAAAAYRLGTPVPDYWYPLVAATSATGQPLLEIAGFPAAATGVSDAGVRGLLIDKTPGIPIADEEATRQGTRAIRRDRLARTPAGTSVWRARAKDPGLGEASSGLRFDILQ